MTAQEFDETLRGLLDRTPFQPFLVEYEDGERIWIDGPYVAFSDGDASFLGPNNVHFFDHKNVKQFLSVVPQETHT